MLFNQIVHRIANFSRYIPSIFQGKNALHIAAQENRNNVIEALVTATNVSIDQKAHDGKTAFRLAAIEGID